MTFIITLIGGKQYKMEPNLWYDVNYIKHVKEGDIILLNKILYYQYNKTIKIGQPYIKNGYVPALILGHFKSPKIKVFKMKRKKHYKKMYGYRSILTRLKLI